ncbi:MAG TPA: hypothetical protein VEC39_12530 [Vicinamibacterales bacterium]|nr:hypothetical protein [Vicinamibacterales bacterium]
MRLEPVSLEHVEPRIRAVLDAQAARWGAPLINHLLYARVPAIFHAVRAMWGGIGAAGQIEEALQALVNRRVASLNGCEF